MYTGLKTTSLCQGCDFGAASGSREGRRNLYSKDRVGGEEPLVARVKLPGQLEVTSSQGHSSTLPQSSGALRLTHMFI